MSIEKVIDGLQIAEVTPAADGLELQDPFTWSIWAAVQQNPDATFRAIFSFSTIGQTNSGYNLLTQNSRVRFYLRVGPPNQWKSISALADVVVGRWYHYTGRVFDDGVNVNMQFWIDGVSQGTLSWESLTMSVRYEASNNLRIGSYGVTSINCYAADFAIWAAKLSDAQIWELSKSPWANAPLMIQSESFKGYWRFDELNDGENELTALKYFFNYSAGTGGSFQPVGSGNAYGRLAPCPYRADAYAITFQAPVAAGLPKGSLALCGVGV